VTCYRLMQAGPALANQWHCSNCASESTSPPFLSLSSPSFPFRPFPSSPVKTSWRIWGSAVSPPTGFRADPQPQLHFAALYARKMHLFAAFSGSLVSNAMSGKMKANPGFGRIWNYLTAYKMALPEIGRFWQPCLPLMQVAI